jgi:hypothetical protein
MFVYREKENIATYNFLTIFNENAAINMTVLLF